MKKKFMLLSIIIGVVFIMPLTHSFSVKIKCKTFDQTCACERLTILEGNYFNLKSQPRPSWYIKIHVIPANKNYYYDSYYLWSHTFNRIYESSFYLYLPLDNFTREIHIEDSLGNKCGYFNISEFVCSELANYFLFCRNKLQSDHVVNDVLTRDYFPLYLNEKNENSSNRIKIIAGGVFIFLIALIIMWIKKRKKVQEVENDLEEAF